MARLSKGAGDSSTEQNDFLKNYLDEYAQSEQVDVGQVLGWLLLNVCDHPSRLFALIVPNAVCYAVFNFLTRPCSFLVARTPQALHFAPSSTMFLKTREFIENFGLL